MSICGIPEKGLPESGRNTLKIKALKYSMNSSSLLFSCSICAMYNRVHHAQRKHLMLKQFIPGLDSSVGANICYNNYFTQKLVNELHYWVENHPRVIQSPNVS